MYIDLEELTKLSKKEKREIKEIAKKSGLEVKRLKEKVRIHKLCKQLSISVPRAKAILDLKGHYSEYIRDPKSFENRTELFSIHVPAYIDQTVEGMNEAHLEWIRSQISVKLYEECLKRYNQGISFRNLLSTKYGGTNTSGVISNKTKDRAKNAIRAHLLETSVEDLPPDTVRGDTGEKPTTTLYLMDARIKGLRDRQLYLDSSNRMIFAKAALRTNFRMGPEKARLRKDNYEELRANVLIGSYVITDRAMDRPENYPLYVKVNPRFTYVQYVVDMDNNQIATPYGASKGVPARFRYCNGCEIFVTDEELIVSDYWKTPNMKVQDRINEINKRSFPEDTQFLLYQRVDTPEQFYKLIEGREDQKIRVAHPDSFYHLGRASGHKGVRCFFRLDFLKNAGYNYSPIIPLMEEYERRGEFKL